MVADKETAGTEWPGLAPAQHIVVPSYQWMLTRLEAVDGRIQTLMTLVSIVTIGLPAASRAVGSGRSFESVWFVLAMVLAAVSIGLGASARMRGFIVLPDPMVLYKTSLHLQEWEFQRDALYFAGEHFAKNRATVEGKHTALIWMTWTFFAELVCLLGWVAAW